MPVFEGEVWPGADGSSWPASWSAGHSPTGGSTTVEGGYGRQVTGSATGYNFNSRTSRRRSTQLANIVHRVKFRYLGEVFPQLWVRADSSMRGDTGYNMAISASNWRVNGYSGFSTLFAGTVITQALSAGADYWAEFGAVDTQIKARLYADGADVPDWQYETTDATLTTGYYGLGAYPGNLGTTRVEWDNWSASDTFPVPAAVSGFPVEPLPVVVQAKFDGSTWTDITADVYTRELITIVRGQSNEQSKAEPSKADLQINNRSGDYSPRNPMGAYHGLIGRNTELRVGITEDESWLKIAEPTGTTAFPQYVTTPDDSSLDITEDIDIRFDADLDSWREAMELVSKYTTSGNQRSWTLFLVATGYLTLTWSTDGTFATVQNRSPTVSVPVTAGRLAVRVTLDVDNGAGGNTTTFYTSDSIDGTWTQLGDPVIVSGTTSIFASTATLDVLDSPGNTTLGSMIHGKVYGAEVRNGIAGTIVAKPDFTIQQPGATWFADAAGRPWTLHGVEITNLNVRVHGEVPEWPSRWDISQKDVWSPIQAAGLMRRLGQGKAPLSSTQFRAMTSAEDTDVVAYWPVEDADGAESIAAGRQGGRPMLLAAGDNTQFASFSGFPGSDPVATLGDQSVWTGSIPPYTGTGLIQLWWMMAIPAAGAANNQTIISVLTTGTIGRVLVRYGTGSSGTLQIESYDQDGASLGATGTLAFGVNGKLLKCSLDLTQNGSDVDMDIKTLTVGDTGGFTAGYTVSSRTVSRATSVVVSTGGELPDVAIGQISVHKAIRSLFDSSESLNAWRGETMGRRIQRLCREEGVALRTYGDLDDTVQGGFQKSKSFLELLQECADADGGILHESREDLSLAYRPRSAMQGQNSARATIPYDSARDLEPIEDDQNIVNDVTISRPEGGSRRVELLTGPMSVERAPVGVGRYPTSETRNLGYDTQLEDHASWRVHLGTVDEARYPTVDVQLEHPDISGDPDLTAALRGADLGDRLVITGPMPEWISPDDIDQLVLGTTEVLGVHGHQIITNNVPYRPYRVGTYDDEGVTRYDTGGSELDSGVSSTATSLSIATTTGPLWTTDAGSFPFPARLGAERVTVTNISGTTSPQTATVIRSVNNVVLAHSAGTIFGLADPAYYGL